MITVIGTTKKRPPCVEANIREFVIANSRVPRFASPLFLDIQLLPAFFAPENAMCFGSCKKCKDLSEENYIGSAIRSVHRLPLACENNEKAMDIQMKKNLFMSVEVKMGVEEGILNRDVASLSVMGQS